MATPWPGKYNTLAKGNPSEFSVPPPQVSSTNAGHPGAGMEIPGLKPETYFSTWKLFTKKEKEKERKKKTHFCCFLYSLHENTGYTFPKTCKGKQLSL